VNQKNQWFRQLAKKTTCPAQDLGFRIYNCGGVTEKPKE